MGDIKSLQQLSLAAAFLSPGLIALFVRAQFLTGRSELSKDNALAFFVLSTIYYALGAPFLPWLSRHGMAPTEGAIPLILWTFLGPAVFGAVLGLNASKGWSWRILHRLGIRTVHVIPTAWDRAFGTMSPSWLTVTLRDGSKVRGFFGQNSFASSNPDERDLLIQSAFTAGDDNKWIEVPSCSILVPGGEISCIEIVPDRKVL